MTEKQQLAYLYKLAENEVRDIKHIKTHFLSSVDEATQEIRKVVQNTSNSTAKNIQYEANKVWKSMDENLRSAQSRLDTIKNDADKIGRNAFIKSFSACLFVALLLIGGTFGYTMYYTKQIEAVKNAVNIKNAKDGLYIEADGSNCYEVDGQVWCKVK